MLAKVGNKDSHSVIQVLIKQARKLPKELYRSLTWDRGTEMVGHKNSPWRRISTSFCASHIHPSRQIATQSLAGQCVAKLHKPKYQPSAATVLPKRHGFVDT